MLNKLIIIPSLDKVRDEISVEVGGKGMKHGERGR